MRSDSTHVLVSNGEYVINADSTSRHRALLDAINSGAPRFASGGMVCADAAPGSIGSGSGNATTIAPTIHVNVQGSPGQSPQYHQRLGAEIAKAAGQHLQKLIGDELRKRLALEASCDADGKILTVSFDLC